MVEWDLFEEAGRIVADLNIPALLSGLTLQVPESLVLAASRPENVSVTVSENKLVLAEIQGHIQLVFEKQAEHMK